MTGFDDRIAGAPISWGVCEVPGWGYQMRRERVLREMSEIGLAATEFGPDGFLPKAPREAASVLAAHHLAAAGGFLPLLLHDPSHDPMPRVRGFLDTCAATGARVMVLAAQTGRDGYEARPTIGADGWRTLLANLDRIDDEARARHVRAALHPHLGTMIEQTREVQRVVEGAGIGLCLDTGHLLAAGTDPVRLARDHADRIAHVHLKDVDAAIAAQLRDGRLGYGDAVDRGLFRPLGRGDVDVTALVHALESAGYDGWYVLEQDIRLSDEPAADGPAHEVADSLDYLRSVAP